MSESRVFPLLSLSRAKSLLLIFLLGALSHRAAAFPIVQDDPPDPPRAGGSDPLPENPFPQAPPVPNGILEGGTGWLNTDRPISISDLRGKVVLIDFWTYCCINCMHVLPDLKYLEEKYPNELVVIGVHSAKFDNEKITENIRDAVLRYEIRHPVINDSEMIVWQKFGTRAWPTLALIDPEGRYCGSQSGEGHRELLDRVISRVVDYHRAKGTLNEEPLEFRLEAESAQQTALRYPGKLLADQAGGRLFISDSNHNRIVVTAADGRLLDVIGSGAEGSTDGTFASAKFFRPQGTVLHGDMLYIADTENHLIRVADLQNRTVTTLAGNGRQNRRESLNAGLREVSLNSPWDLCIADETLFIAMAGPHQIWRHQLGSDRIEVHAGSGREDVTNGPLSESAFAQPSGIVLSDAEDVMYIADSEGSAIRIVPVSESGAVETLAGTSELPRGQSLFAFGYADGVGSDARFQHPIGLTRAGGKLFVADSYNHCIRAVDIETAAVSTVTGTREAGSSTEPLQFSEPAGLTVFGDSLLVADTNNHRIVRYSLTDGKASVLAIEGLQPPVLEIATEVSSADRALMNRSAAELPAGPPVEPAVHRAGAPVKFQAELQIPEGFKMNPLAPVTWQLTQLEGDAVLDPAALGSRDAAEVTQQSAEFTVAGSGQPGTGKYLLELGYGYCSADESDCRLATVRVLVVLSAADEGSEEPVEFTAPLPEGL